MGSLIEQVDCLITARKILRDGDSVLLAVSGGVDSMVLLEILRTLSSSHRWNLAVAHFNHHLRGRASDADERSVRRACEKFGLRCETGGARVDQVARERGLSTEMAARELRHAFLAKSATRLGVRKIALAHHADDQVELFLLRLLRGSSALGLGGMNWNSPSPADPSLTLIRPLLGTSKADIAAFAREHKVKFREDSTNATTDFLRNRIRHELLPLLRREYQPGIADVLLRQADLLREDADFVLAEARRVIAGGDPRFAALAPAVQRRVLHMRLIAEGIQPDFALVEKLRADAGSWTMVSPGLSVRATIAGEIEKRTALSPANPSPAQLRVDLSSASSAQFDGVSLHWKFGRGSTRPKPRPNSESFDADKIGPKIVLRHWRPGDRFQPIGMKTPVRLQDLFVNNKVPRPQRQLLLVAAGENDEIFWVEGLRISENHKITARTRRRLEWSWTRSTESAPANLR